MIHLYRSPRRTQYAAGPLLSPTNAPYRVRKISTGWSVIMPLLNAATAGWTAQLNGCQPSGWHVARLCPLIRHLRKNPARCHPSLRRNPLRGFPTNECIANLFLRHSLISRFKPHVWKGIVQSPAVVQSDHAQILA